MAKIVIDAGHGGRDPGAVWDGRQEKDDSLALALAVGEKLADQGVDVVYTRTEDIYQTPFEKAQISNRENPEFFCVHSPQFQPGGEPVYWSGDPGV